MRQRIYIGLFAAGLALGGVCGCSQQSQQQYGSAANHLAAKATTAADNDKTSMDVKSALMGAKEMNTSRMRVDTDGKHVTLSGSVPTSEQKTRASAIAKNVLGAGYSLTNQLTVSKF